MGKPGSVSLEYAMSDTNDPHADPHADPVVVGIYDTEFEAALVKNMLGEAGIPAQMGEQAIALIAQEAESNE